jgi:hypothetical protein
VKRIDEQRPRPWFAGVARASVYLGIGDTARALTAYEQAAGPPPLVSYLNAADPAFDPLRGSARFALLVRRSGLDPAALAALRASARAASARVSALRRS